MRSTKRLVSGAIGLCLFLSLGALAVDVAFGPDRATAQEKVGDPLPSWNDGPTKQAILKFVNEVTDKDSKHYIPPEDRIATFDNDGTLWCEMPVVEGAFTRARLKGLAAKDPTLKEKQPFKAVLEGDHAYVHKAGTKAVLDVVIATHGDMAHDQFVEEVRTFYKTEKHPRFGVPYQKLAYQPMVEVLRYLRANGFQTWICSGGWMDFMRPITQEAYGVPPQQVIGSSLKMQFREKDGKHVLWILPQLLAFCDQENKPVEIALHIGKRPVFAAGNVRSGGDIAMLTYCQGRKGASFQLMVNHDDAEREYAYSEPKGESLEAARKNGWTVVSMKKDWKQVFSK